MVARTPSSKEKRRAAPPPLSPSVVRETVRKVEKCVARLQELQYTVTGGNKTVAGTSLSPRSTRGYLRTSLRCKQETLRSVSSAQFSSARMKNAAAKGSPARRLPERSGEWRRMSLPAMLLGETVSEIMQASRFTTGEVAGPADPRTPVTGRRRGGGPVGEMRARRTREKEYLARSGSKSPPVRKARARISFKPASPPQRRSVTVATHRISPKTRPWAKKAVVLFPNPVFSRSPSSGQERFCKTGSPVIGRGSTRRGPPHRFLIKSPPAPARMKSSQRSPPVKLSGSARAKVAVVAKLRRSFSPARLASRLAAMSPLRSRPSKREAEEQKPVGSGRRRR